MQSSSSLNARGLRATCLQRQPVLRAACKPANLQIARRRLSSHVVASTGPSSGPSSGSSSGGVSKEEARGLERQRKESRETKATSPTSPKGPAAASTPPPAPASTTARASPVTPASPTTQSSSYAAAPESRAVDNSRTAATSAQQTTNAAASQAQSQVDSTAASAKQGIRQARSSTSRGANELADQAEQTADRVADQADRTADQLAGQAQSTARAADRGADQAADQIEEGADQAADAVEQAGDQVAQAVRQARDALRDAPPPEELADQARDAVDSAVESARNSVSAALSPGPGAPFQAVPLTSLPLDPFSASGTEISKSGRLKYFKYRLLASVAGLDRGFVATPEAASQVEDAVSYLISAADPVNLSWTVDESKGRRSSLAQLNGLWRLVYSSNFAGGYSGLGGTSSPFNLGQVFQSISTYASRLDNIVELYAKVNLPQLPFLPPVAPIVTTATLKHSFEPVGYGTVQLTFEDTEIKTTGGVNNILGNLPEVTFPQLPEPLRPSRQQRTSRFDNLYLDDEVRVSRGSRGELRVFVRT